MVRADFDIIVKICERAEALGISQGERITLLMDLENVHKNVGLKLADLLAADDANFAHDVCGIQRHINRNTGALEDFFLPRFAKPEKG